MRSTNDGIRQILIHVKFHTTPTQLTFSQQRAQRQTYLFPHFAAMSRHNADIPFAAAKSTPATQAKSKGVVGSAAPGLPPPTAAAQNKAAAARPPARDMPTQTCPERFVIWIGQKHSTSAIQSEAGLRQALAPFQPFELHNRGFDGGGFCLVKSHSLEIAWKLFAFGKKNGLNLGKQNSPMIESVNDKKPAPPLSPEDMRRIWSETWPGCIMRFFYTYDN